MVKKFLFLLLLSAVLPVFAAEELLKIINPTVVINQKKIRETRSPGGTVTRDYVAQGTLYLLNAGKQNCRVAAKPYLVTCNVNAISGAGVEQTYPLPGVMLIRLIVNPEIKLRIIRDAKREVYPVILPESSFQIVELRPGEVVQINFPFHVRQDRFRQIEQVVFEYVSSNQQGRYPFWNGNVKSQSYPFVSRKHFRIISDMAQNSGSENLPAVAGDRK